MRYALDEKGNVVEIGDGKDMSRHWLFLSELTPEQKRQAFCIENNILE